MEKIEQGSLVAVNWRELWSAVWGATRLASSVVERVFKSPCSMIVLSAPGMLSSRELLSFLFSDSPREYTIVSSLHVLSPLTTTTTTPTALLPRRGHGAHRVHNRHGRGAQIGLFGPVPVLARPRHGLAKIGLGVRVRQVERVLANARGRGEGTEKGLVVVVGGKDFQEGRARRQKHESSQLGAVGRDEQIHALKEGHLFGERCIFKVHHRDGTGNDVCRVVAAAAAAAAIIADSCC